MSRTGRSLAARGAMPRRAGGARRARTRSRGSQVTRCYEAILDGIVRRRFLPGDTLAPDELARELGVSRTPVQDALKRLALEGLVQIRPRRGTVVTRITAKEFREFVDARLMIELHAARAAVEQATAEEIAAFGDLVERLRRVLVAADGQPAPDAWFEDHTRLHRTIVALASNDLLLRLYDGLHFDLRFRRIFIGWGLSLLQDNARLHDQMLRALRARDAGALQEAIRADVGQGAARIGAALDLVGGAL
jgi:DNA-binding GntR family transcriptional regulator